jgi:predicted DNA-binding protein
MEPKTILKTFRLREETFEELASFAEMEGRSVDAIVQEALEAWFDARHKALLEKNLADENAQTNLSYDEFWDGVEL